MVKPGGNLIFSNGNAADTGPAANHCIAATAAAASQGLFIQKRILSLL